MWHYGIHYSYTVGVTPFAEFLEFTIFNDRLHPDDPPISLMDALGLWLDVGDGFLHCPTFESFLVATIAIIDDWLKHDRVAVDNCVIWPFGDKVAVPLTNGEYGKSDDQVHPLLRREVYEQMRSLRRAEDKEDTDHLIDRLLRHFAVPDDDLHK